MLSFHVMNSFECLRHLLVVQEDLIIVTIIFTTVLQMSQTFTGGAVRFNGDYFHNNIYNSAVNVPDIHQWCSQI